MKKLFVILSAISFMLYALVDFGKNVLETHFRVLLMLGEQGFSNDDYFVYAGKCQTVLATVGAICLVAFVVSFLKKEKK
ncbi:MAG: hypothetical protein IKT70_06150 [Clostridia bacterium]|nr:hypothetical protein [Clostridia bacterium]